MPDNSSVYAAHEATHARAMSKPKRILCLELRKSLFVPDKSAELNRSVMGCPGGIISMGSLSSGCGAVKIPMNNIQKGLASSPV